MPNRPKKIINLLLEKKANGNKMFAVLIDPDKANEAHLALLIKLSIHHKVDFLMVGGSLITSSNLDFVVKYCKQHSTIPVILFPSGQLSINEFADGLLFLSLTSGRNAEYLIGQQVSVAPFLINSQLDIMATSYLLIDGGKPTTVSYLSGTNPIPRDKPEIAAATAFAGELLGHQLVFLDCGSGAQQSIKTEMIQKVKEWTTLPILCGGGIDSAGKAKAIWEAGADLIVVGNAIENSLELIKEIAEAKYYL